VAGQCGVAVCNGTVALELALSTLDIPAGREVILPSFTIVGCLEAVLRNSLIPVLVDCDSRTHLHGYCRCAPENHIPNSSHHACSYLRTSCLYGGAAFAVARIRPQDCGGCRRGSRRQNTWLVINGGVAGHLGMFPHFHFTPTKTLRQAKAGWF